MSTHYTDCEKEARQIPIERKDFKGVTANEGVSPRPGMLVELMAGCALPSATAAYHVPTNTNS